MSKSGISVIISLMLGLMLALALVSGLVLWSVLVLGWGNERKCKGKREEIKGEERWRTEWQQIFG